MIPTSEQLAAVYVQQQKGFQARQIRHRTGLEMEIVKAALASIRQFLREWEQVCRQAEKYDTLISFQHPWREQERGRSLGAVGKSSSDTAPNGWKLLPFLGVLCALSYDAERDFVSTPQPG